MRLSKIFRGLRFTRSFLDNGGRVPRFYLPVREDFETGDYECWWFVFAPFVLILHIGNYVCQSIWNDAFDYFNMSQRFYRKSGVLR